MVERVGVGQTRFTVPGLALDDRGVASGRQMIVRFAALDRLISFLRVWSGEQTLNDVEPGMRLVYARAAGGPRDALVSLSLPSASLSDALARAARLSGGQCFTGAGKHFVQYRDPRAPLGYDVSRLETVADAVSFVLYGLDQTWTYVLENEMSLEKLVLQLDLQRLARVPKVEGEHDAFFLTVRRGLAATVIEYLHRAQHKHAALRVSAAFCEPPSDSAFRREPAFWLMKLAEVPQRLFGWLTRTPGLTLFAPITENVAVAAGYRHPIHLEACRQALAPQRLFLFAPAPRGVTVVDPAPSLVPIGDLVRLGTGAAGPTSVADGGKSRVARAVSVEPLVVPLRLEPAPAKTARATAALIAWEHASWLRALCYALPASALRGYRVAVLERGVLVMAPDVLSGIPFGQLLYAPGPGLLVPLGWEIRPRVSPLELAANAGATGGAVVLFPGPASPPFRITADAIQPLQASTLSDPGLGHLSVEGSIATPPAPAPREVEIENHPLGPMPLWGLKT